MPGIGLPDPVFTSFELTFFSVSGSGWACATQIPNGGYCSAPKPCLSYINGTNVNLTRYNFKIYTQSNSSYYFRLPIVALIRDNTKNGVEQIILLVNSTDLAYQDGDFIVFGQAFFQNFEAVFYA